MPDPFDVVEIPAGPYRIGDDGLPAAAPRHERRLDAPVWVDRRPVPVSVFAAFVVDGGYARADLWPGDAAPSVDARCEAVRAASVGFGPDRPALGLTWFEASAIARATGGRLPFEVEWEVAATAQAGVAIDRPAGVSEWTADAFAARYWRADVARRGVPWSASAAAVVVRGAAPGDVVSHPAARRGGPPDVADAHRGFRRAWDQPPPGGRVVRPPTVVRREPA